MREKFIEQRFNRNSVALINKAIVILNEYEEQGFTLTLRQLYYQFVARGFLENNQKEYKRLGNVINNARLAGLIDWNSIEDRTRYLRDFNTWNNPDEIIEDASRQYREDLWRNQNNRVEIWIEKDALLGVIEPFCNRYRIPYFACRGYSSQSEQYSAGKRLSSYISNGQEPVIFHLGDHDPSGLDMSRDNLERLNMFSYSEIEFHRLALNYNQVEQYNPPPNFAKETDTRAADYINSFGVNSWELDALSPTVIDGILETAISPYIDQDQWDTDLEQEIAKKEELKTASDNWTTIQKYLKRKQRQSRPKNGQD